MVVFKNVKYKYLIILTQGCLMRAFCVSKRIIFHHSKKKSNPWVATYSHSHDKPLFPKRSSFSSPRSFFLRKLVNISFLAVFYFDSLLCFFPIKISSPLKIPGAREILTVFANYYHNDSTNKRDFP